MNDRSDIENKIDLEEVLNRLTSRERQAVTLYRDGYTQAEIGKKLGVSHQSISRMFKKMVAKSAEWSVLSSVED